MAAATTTTTATCAVCGRTIKGESVATQGGRRHRGCSPFGVRTVPVDDEPGVPVDAAADGGNPGPRAEDAAHPSAASEPSASAAFDGDPEETPVCGAALPLVIDGRRSGEALCILDEGHPGTFHRATWTEAEGDERSVEFQAGYEYDTRFRSLSRSSPSPAPSKSVAKRVAAQRGVPLVEQLGGGVPPESPLPTEAARDVTIVTLVRLEQLRESPTNPRRTWGDMTELADSVRRLGVLQPVLARPMGDGYELVFGHRRFRAARAAELVEVPALVREMSDQEALEAQVVENSARQDVHALEEAESYELLHQRHGLGVEEIAAKVGKSRSAVYARMKLLGLVPAAREAFYGGRLSPSVALYVARVPASMQVDALEQLEKRAAESDWEAKLEKRAPAPLSARDAGELLRERYTLRLADAPFDRADAELVPGAGPCATCPKRSGAQPELFADIDDGPDVCTDPECFGSKRAAAAAKVAAKLTAKGIAVVDSKRDRFGNIVPPKGYVTVTSHLLGAGKTAGELLEKVRGKAKVPEALATKTMMVGDRGKPVEVVRKADLVAAAGVKSPAEAQSAHAEKYKRDQAERDRQDKIDALVETRVASALAEAAEAPGVDGVFFKLIRLACVWLGTESGSLGEELVERHGWKPDKGSDKWNRSYTSSIERTPDAKIMSLFVELLAESRGGEDFADGACKLLKVDAAKIRKAILAEVALEEAAKASAAPAEPVPMKKAAKKKGRRS